MQCHARKGAFGTGYLNYMAGTGGYIRSTMRYVIMRLGERTQNFCQDCIYWRRSVSIINSC